MHPQLKAELSDRGRNWRPLSVWLLPESRPTWRMPNAVPDIVAVLAFGFTGTGRYVPTGVSTWCNIFVWDVTCAMHAEVPHWVTPDNKPCKPGTPGARELRANPTVDLLGKGTWGYAEVDRETAQAHADMGRIVVVGWQNPDPAGDGHVGVVLPGYPAAQMRIAQAGKRCSKNMLLTEGFGQRPVRFFSHA